MVSNNNKKNSNPDPNNTSDTRADDKIRPQDIQRSLNRLQGEVDSSIEAAIPLTLIIGVGVAVLVVAGAFLLGVRRAKRQTTLIEVRRF